MSVARLMRALPVAGIMVLLGFYAGWFSKAQLAPLGSANQANMHWVSSPFAWIVLAGVLFLGIQTWANYRREWYDPALALQFQELFESDEVRHARSAAMQEFKATGKWSRKVEPVLDVFEDIGFYVENEQISCDVAHHHFYHWIRGYVQMSDEYIKLIRTKDPLAYECCPKLLERVSSLEAKKLKKRVSELHWDSNDINDFIQDEIEESLRAKINSTEQS